MLCEQESSYSAVIKMLFKSQNWCHRFWVRNSQKDMNMLIFLEERVFSCPEKAKKPQCQVENNLKIFFFPDLHGKLFIFPTNLKLSKQKCLTSIKIKDCKKMDVYLYLEILKAIKKKKKKEIHFSMKIFNKVCRICPSGFKQARFFPFLTVFSKILSRHLLPFYLLAFPLKICCFVLISY